MIHKIVLENFKGIKDRVEIDLKPITLLFGPNSAGKSTLVQAFHYLKEILERYNTDPGKTSLGGEAIDLGGYANLVHREQGEPDDHYKKKSIVIGVGVEEDEMLVPELFDENFEKIPEIMREAGYVVYYLEFTISWDDKIGKPIVKRYDVTVYDKHIGRIEMDGWMSDVQFDKKRALESARASIRIQQAGDKPKFNLKYIDVDHPFLEFHEDDEMPNDVDELDNEPGKLFKHYINSFPIMKKQPDELGNNADHTLFGNYAAFPDFEPVTIGSGALVMKGVTGGVDENYDLKIGKFHQAIIDKALTHIFTTPILMLREALQNFRYIGPLRTIPERTFEPDRYPNEGRWSDGLGAWDDLFRKLSDDYKDHSDYLKQINKWLEDLNLGYTIKIKEYKELDTDSPLAMGLDNAGRPLEESDQVREEFSKIPSKFKIVLFEEKNQIEVSAKDIGSGVTQVFPIIVALVDYEAMIVAVEQPELHVHPAIQQKIADMFIHFRSDSNLCILETHSEHIMLRLLRRIEETTSSEIESPDLSLTPEYVSVVYVEPIEDGVNMAQLPIDDTGEFTKDWPHGFFEERGEDLF